MCFLLPKLLQYLHLLVIYVTVCTLSRRIPARVISWQSKTSTRCSTSHDVKWSSAASEISGQLSSSKTASESDAHAPDPTWRTPSSVIISQWDRLCVRHKHTIYIWLHYWHVSTSFSPTKWLHQLATSLWIPKTTQLFNTVFSRGSLSCLHISFECMLTEN